jgi:hypothetical protein
MLSLYWNPLSSGPPPMKTTQVLSLDSTGLLNVATTLGCRDHAPETSSMVYRKGT